MATQDSKGIMTRLMISSVNKAGQWAMKLDKAENKNKYINI